MCGRQRPVLIVGAGPIGVAFAAAFAASGRRVILVEPDATARAAAPAAIAHHDAMLRRAGHPACAAPEPVDIISDLSGEGGNVGDAALAIECGPERAAIKAEIFAGLPATLPADAVLATASSSLPISAIVPDPTAQRRCLVAHPGNPPSLIRVVEIVPGPHTEADAVSAASAIFEEAAFTPVLLEREVPAFVFNRLQSALLREAYRLVAEGVIDVDGLDRLVRDGLGPRWALGGPFETADLNTAGGIRGHAERLGPAYAAIGAARGETEPAWSAELVSTVEAQRRVVLPEAELPARRAWRERALADLLAARRSILSGGTPS
ncbi:MAG: 3-hydroxyacyl-CoA dehydrogenase NAD-binding domain-containing protein [Pseudomonadota bacterium]